MSLLPSITISKCKCKTSTSLQLSLVDNLDKPSYPVSNVELLSFVVKLCKVPGLPEKNVWNGVSCWVNTAVWAELVTTAEITCSAKRPDGATSSSSSFPSSSREQGLSLNKHKIALVQGARLNCYIKAVIVGEGVQSGVKHLWKTRSCRYQGQYWTLEEQCVKEVKRCSF